MRILDFKVLEAISFKNSLMKLLNALLMPVKYFKYIKQKEQMLVLCLCCIYKNIEDPDVWDVKALHDSANEMLELLHKDPSAMKAMKDFEFKRDMFWHLLLSKFMCLKISRETVQWFVRVYSVLKSPLQKALSAEDESKKITPIDFFMAWELLRKAFV